MSKKECFQYGGQAVIEGVMMRGPQEMAIAVRLPDGTIEVEKQQLSSWLTKWPWLKWPGFRGVVALLEALVVGTRALAWSASKAMPEEEGELTTKELVLTIAFALGLGILLFVIIPAGAVKLVEKWVTTPLGQNIAEGGLRIAIFLAYIGLISRMKDIQRVFQYHGAEHKVIHTYEAGLELTVENARGFSPLHPRCGTSFLLVVMVVSIFVFAFLGHPPNLFWRIGSRILLMPLVAAISYEFIKLSGRYGERWWLKWLVAPGLGLQRLTTREPDDSQLEVAIHALKAVLRGEEHAG
ncbi:DUF1385 domain-containing protein [Carboxydocella sp. JDF658]|uniref:DUF1385 domain-containing protein n=1 Tax=Carboxydocella sp. JDF658 TaxID=1926600 RepID=UPI0009ABC0FC|nr:DUF1385 domain-containing protein [Carboxydocella sp. JDF658]GAW30960.1 membrane protein [Carboxydocella sp. JDF658]